MQQLVVWLILDQLDSKFQNVEKVQAMKTSTHVNKSVQGCSIQIPVLVQYGTVQDNS